MVDVADLKFAAARRAGSIPAPGTSDRIEKAPLSGAFEFVEARPGVEPG